MDTERKQTDQEGQRIEEADMENVGDGTDVAKGDLEKGRSHNKDVSGSGEASWDDAFLVTFGQNDAQNPFNWTKKRKWGVTAAVSGTGFVRIMVSTMMAPAINTMAEELHMSITESNMALSVYLLATAFGPLIIGPLSEIYGRKTIFHITNIWFLVWNFVCGFTHSKGLLISARLLAGFGASAVYSLGYGVLGDVWSAEQRGQSLSLYLLIPLTGSAVGPIVSGFIIKYSTWRWMFWSTAILQLTLELSFSLLFHESYAPLLLRRRAEKLRRDTGDSRYHAAIEMREVGLSPLGKLGRSLSRPLRLLAFHPIIQMQAILEGIDYGLLYFALSSFSALHVAAYSESVEISGLHYIAICIGTISGSQLCGPLMDYTYHRLTSNTGETQVPELRIPLLLPGALFTPIGFLLYGWAAQYHIFWVVVDVGAALLSLGMQIFDTTLHAYVIVG
ncbi:MFS transporter [Aspergillus affinis]|uniref:MFS transporter n=1 Tax=Aspergillus affinis TaxID=1070780 RepID=UPI0022FE836F|nr:MFS transporter [Aspergillus affinis]KAI9039796.1 MFS transporter [Aspergillus affinis]